MYYRWRSRAVGTRRPPLQPVPGGVGFSGVGQSLLPLRASQALPAHTPTSVRPDRLIEAAPAVACAVGRGFMFALSPRTSDVGLPGLLGDAPVRPVAVPLWARPVGCRASPLRFCRDASPGLGIGCPLARQRVGRLRFPTRPSSRGFRPTRLTGRASAHAAPCRFPYSRTRSAPLALAGHRPHQPRSWRVVRVGCRRSVRSLRSFGPLVMSAGCFVSCAKVEGI